MRRSRSTSDTGISSSKPLKIQNSFLISNDGESNDHRWFILFFHSYRQFLWHYILISIVFIVYSFPILQILSKLFKLDCLLASSCKKIIFDFLYLIITNNELIIYCYKYSSISSCILYHLAFYIPKVFHQKVLEMWFYFLNKSVLPDCFNLLGIV